jgi:hypothetical protein
LDITGVKLVDGNGSFSGRVEIKVDGVWGTICDYNFDMNDAEVICRTLNLTYVDNIKFCNYLFNTFPLFVKQIYGIFSFNPPWVGPGS